MKNRANLRFRAILAFAFLGALTSTGVAVVLYLLTLHMEEGLVADTLSVEIEDVMARYAQDPSLVPPSGRTVRFYVIDPRDPQGAPAALLELTPGLHRIELGSAGYFAEVRLQDSLRYVALYNDASIRKREAQFRAFLTGGVCFMTLLAALLGWWLARRVIAPVTELAARVSAMQPQGPSAPLTTGLAPDEVGELARCFDAYQVRLAAFIERERAFTGDISHELRTPLAVIEGAAEVLLADPELAEAKRQRVQRIMRASREATEMITALLALAREEAGESGAARQCDVAQVLEALIDELLAVKERKPVDIVLSIEDRPVMHVDPSLLRVVLANLIRNAIAYTVDGSVKIHLHKDGFCVTDTGVGMNEEELARMYERHYRAGNSGGAGIGLSLVNRICKRYGWQIQAGSEVGVGTRMTLSWC